MDAQHVENYAKIPRVHVDFVRMKESHRYGSENGDHQWKHYNHKGRVATSIKLFYHQCLEYEKRKASHCKENDSRIRPFVVFLVLHPHAAENEIEYSFYNHYEENYRERKENDFPRAHYEGVQPQGNEDKCKEVDCDEKLQVIDRKLLCTAPKTEYCGQQ